MQKICEICGQSYTPDKRNFDKSRTCSRKCHSMLMNQIQTEKGTRFTRDYSFMKGNQNRKGHKPVNGFDSRDISGDKHPGWKPKVVFTCKMCGKEFGLPEWRTKAAGRKNDFCSAKCRSEYRARYQSGENAPDYVGGPQTYRGRGWLKARQAVIERQNGKCAHCGQFVGQSLPVHHIRPFREFASVAEANDLSNLVGLCQSCHMKAEHLRRPAP